MPTRNDVYSKFGITFEVAQLLEFELGNLLLNHRANKAYVDDQLDLDKYRSLLDFVVRQTLGGLLRHLNESTDSLEKLESLLSQALVERNRLTHKFFFVQHDNRLNSESGRRIMMKDLEDIHTTLFDAGKAVMSLSGLDINKRFDEELSKEELSTSYIPS